ncbi:hypothetical protein ACFL1C_03895 [Pseudomonadota bacterium]|jgi:hypothetical protein
MKSKLHLALQILLWGICAFNVFIGIGLNISPDFPQLVAGYYGAEVSWTPAFLYIIKPLGAFMIAIGILAGVAARHPLEHSAIIYGVAVLFLLRGLQRLVFQDEIAVAVNIDSIRNIGNAVFFLVLAVFLVGLHRIAAKSGF